MKRLALLAVTAALALGACSGGSHHRAVSRGGSPAEEQLRQRLSDVLDDYLCDPGDVGGPHGDAVNSIVDGGGDLRPNLCLAGS